MRITEDQCKNQSQLTTAGVHDNIGESATASCVPDVLTDIMVTWVINMLWLNQNFRAALAISNAPS